MYTFVATTFVFICLSWTWVQVFQSFRWTYYCWLLVIFEVLDNGWVRMGRGQVLSLSNYHHRLPIAICPCWSSLASPWHGNQNIINFITFTVAMICIFFFSFLSMIACRWLVVSSLCVFNVAFWHLFWLQKKTTIKDRIETVQGIRNTQNKTTTQRHRD